MLQIFPYLLDFPYICFYIYCSLYTWRGLLGYYIPASAPVKLPICLRLFGGNYNMHDYSCWCACHIYLYSIYPLSSQYIGLNLSSTHQRLFGSPYSRLPLYTFYTCSIIHISNLHIPAPIPSRCTVHTYTTCTPSQPPLLLVSLNPCVHDVRLTTTPASTLSYIRVLCCKY